MPLRIAFRFSTPSYPNTIYDAKNKYDKKSSYLRMANRYDVEDEIVENLWRISNEQED